MKNLISMLSILLLFCMVGCQVSTYEVADLELTKVYELHNLESNATVAKYSVYPQINSLLTWKNAQVITADLKMTSFEDNSSDDEYLLSFKTSTIIKEEMTEVSYEVRASRLQETDDKGGLKGTLTITTNEDVESINISLLEVEKYID